MWNGWHAGIRLLLLFLLATSHGNALVISSIFSLSGVGVQYQKAVALAVANATSATPPLFPANTSVSLRQLDAKHQASEAALLTLKELQALEPTSVIIGDYLLDPTNAIALISDIFGVPNMAFSTVPPLDEASYSLFLRMSGVVEDRANATMAFVTALGWKTLYFISSDAAASIVTQDVYQSIAASMGVRMYSVSHKTSVGVNADSTEYHGVMASIKSALTTIASSSNRIVFMDNTFQDAQLVLRVAASMNLTGPKVLSSAYFQWIGDRYWLSDQLFVPSVLCNLSCIATFRSAVPGMIGIAPTTSMFPPAYTDWLDNVWNPAVSVNSLTPTEQELSGLLSWRGGNMSSTVPYVYDAVMMSLITMSELCKSRNCSRPVNGDDFMSELRSLSYSGITGVVTIGNSSYVRASSGLFNMQVDPSTPTGLRYVEVGRWIPTAASPTSVNKSAIVWGTVDGNPPADIGSCPAGEELATSADGLPFCVACAVGTYSLDGIDCRKCPSGAVCPGRDVVIVNVGYWSSGPENNQVSVYTCRPDPNMCCPDDNCTITPVVPGFDICAPNRRGLVCGGCKDGTSEWGGKCVPCHGLNGVALLLLLASAGGTTLALLATPPAPNAVFRLVVDYMQLASLIMTPVTGRSAISTVLESDVLNFDTSALFGGRKRSQDGKGACLAPVPATFSAVFGLAVPTLVLVYMVVLFLMRPLVPRMFPRGWPFCKRMTAPTTVAVVTPTLSGVPTVIHNPVHNNGASGGPNGTRLGQLPPPPPKPLRISKAFFYKGGWRWMFLSYNSVTETMLKVLTCRSVDGKRILQFYPGVECADSQHLPLLIVSAILLFLFVIGVPTFMVLYYKQSARIQAYNSKVLKEHAESLELANILRGSHGYTPTTAATSASPSLIPKTPSKSRGSSSAAEDKMVALTLSDPVKNPGLRITDRPTVVSPYVVVGETAVARTRTADEEEEDTKMDPLIQELYQLYRLRVRGWFEAFYFTRRVLVIVVIVVLVDDLVWRQVALFMMSVLLLFWEIAWKPYATASDNHFSSALMGCICVIGGLEVYVVNAHQQNTIDSEKQMFVDIVELLLFIWPIIYFLRFQFYNGFVVLRDWVKSVRLARITRFRHRQHSIVNRSGDAEHGIQLGPTQDESKRAMQAFTNELDYISKVATHAAKATTQKAARGW